jgi:uncharacterized protein (DUF433 family)
MALPTRRETSPRRVVRNPRILSGEPTLEGTRIAVRTIVEARRHIGSTEKIVDAYPMLDRASVEEALAFYQLHKDEIDQYITENQDPPD